MPGESSVGVDQYLAASESGVSNGPTHHEPAGRIDDVLGVVVDELWGKDVVRHVLHQVSLNDFLLHVRAVLRAHHHGIDALGAAVGILHGDLRFAVGTHVVEQALLADLGHPLAELVR